MIEVSEGGHLSPNPRGSTALDRLQGLGELSFEDSII